MITEADPKDWKAADLRPYVAHAASLFGPERLMFGSDWPVCLLACERWKQVLAACTQALGPQTMAVRDRIFGGTAAGVPGDPHPSADLRPPALPGAWPAS